MEIQKSPSRLEQRQEIRRRVLLPGLIVYGHGAYICDCTIRSLSATGGWVALKQTLPLPRRFYLITIKDGTAFDAQVVWDNGLDMGLKFTAQIPLSETVEIAFTRLKQLWFAKLPH